MGQSWNGIHCVFVQLFRATCYVQAESATNNDVVVPAVWTVFGVANNCHQMHGKYAVQREKSFTFYN